MFLMVVAATLAPGALFRARYGVRRRWHAQQHTNGAHHWKNRAKWAMIRLATATSIISASGF